MISPTPLHTEEKMKEIDDRLKRLTGGGGGGGGLMDNSERMAAIEKAQIQTGMDMHYIKGRIEDMPTKDWITTRLIWVVVSIGAVMAVLQTISEMFS